MDNQKISMPTEAEKQRAIARILDAGLPRRVAFGRELREVLSGSEALPEAASRREEELGDLLFSVVNLSRKLGCEAETCLASTTEKFIRRFRSVEAGAAEQGRRVEELSLPEMDALWEAAKRTESTHDG